jgi:hypothetical protein
MQGATWKARHFLSAGDMEFLLQALTRDDANREGLLRLLVDPESLDQILDSEQLTEALQNAETPLRLSSRLFFYLHLRRAFWEVGLDDRELVDYVAGMCAEFVHEGNLTYPFPERRSALLLSVDYLQHLEKAQGSRRFHLMASAGNHYLFMTGFFAGYIERRSHRKGAPGLGYYVGLGRKSFAHARDHRLAREYALDDIFDQLAQVFPQVRLSLSDVASRMENAA